MGFAPTVNQHLCTAHAPKACHPTRVSITRRRIPHHDIGKGMALAVCDQGYLCDVCGKDVEAITESDLYLRYVMGDVSPLALPSQRERHIRCNPATAQYVIDPAFEPVPCTGLFAKDNLDPAFVKEEEQRI